jgi:diacylglycerol kinase
MLNMEDWNYNNVVESYKYNIDGINTKNYSVVEFSNTAIEIVFDTPIELDYYSGLIIFIE